MITTRREMDIENVGTETASRPVRRIRGEEHVISINTPMPERDEIPSYSAARRSAPVEETYEPLPETRITSAHDPDDLMPLVKSDPAPVQEKRREELKLSSKAKVMLCVYAAAALILAIIVMATGLAISNASGEVASLESGVAARSAVLAEADATLAHLSDADTIMGEAVRNGMTAGGEATEVELLPMSEKTDYAARSNGFDRFCDFLSGIFGG